VSNPQKPTSPYSRNNPERKPALPKKSSVKPPDPWEIPAESGDTGQISIFTSVGRALSFWETYEGQLSVLFTRFITLNRDSLAARRAFSAVRTHEGRIQMLQAAAEAYFTYFPDDNLKIAFNSLIGRGMNLVKLRNNIAHGVVAPYPNNATETPKDNGFVLMPSYANMKDRHINELPKFFYVSSQIDQITMEFNLLLIPLSIIIHTITMKDYIR